MNLIEQIIASKEVIIASDEGIFLAIGGAIVASLIAFIKKNGEAMYKAIGNMIQLAFRGYLRKKSLKEEMNKVNDKDITDHRYYMAIETHLAGYKLPTITNDSSMLDFKMYIADIITLINHVLYKKHFGDYLRNLKYDNFHLSMQCLLSEFIEDSLAAVEKCTNKELRAVYSQVTEAVRVVFFDIISTVTTNDKLSDLEKAYIMLNLFSSHINTSQSVLYKLFLNMNGKVEVQKDNVKAMTKEEVMMICDSLYHTSSIVVPKPLNNS